MPQTGVSFIENYVRDKVVVLKISTNVYLEDKSLSHTLLIQYHPTLRDEKAELQHSVTLKSQRPKHY